MIKLFNSVKKRVNRLTSVRYDRTVGFFFYLLYGYRIYIRDRKQYADPAITAWLCTNIIYRHYLPGSGSLVVDFGAGFGEEAVWLRANSQDVRYVGLEVQPSVYECLCNTYRSLGETFHALPYAVSDSESFAIRSSADFSGVAEDEKGYVTVPTLPWQEFRRRFCPGPIDLLKMNIEGGELALLQNIDDFNDIRRLVVSCHDFRADSEKREHYRTKQKVVRLLTERGYQISTFSFGKDWADDWIFASRFQ